MSPANRPRSRGNPRQKPQKTWVAVEDYMDGLLIPPDSALDAAREASSAAGLPDIAVTPGQGKFLHLLARMRGARHILEIGTLGGYSTIWLARALPANGRLITLEAEAKHCEVARANLLRAGVGGRVDLRLGEALDLLPELAAEGPEPFDFVFIDADKENTAEYFGWAVRLSCAGAVIVVDNVVRDGEVANANTTDSRVEGIRLFLDAAAAEPRVSATSLQTVGSKGYDGFTLALVN
ncbi:MAG TPA: O-methyltransferase [Acidobacteriaceae bacterium]|nr:O-methyltransferase [Acidobacteriaceae bacterium]